MLDESIYRRVKSPLAPLLPVSRGQSSVIGLVLVFGLVLAGTVTVVVLGAGAIDDTQREVGQERTEKAMTQFDSKVALVALGSTDVQQVSFGQDRRNNYDVEEGTGWLRVTIVNQTDGTTETLLNESLGAVTTQNGDTTLAYQGGGVWRTAGGNTSVMVSPPEFHFRGGTLTLPVVNVTGAERLGDRVSISNRETVTKYPNASAGDINPLSNHQVQLTVKSDYYQAWGSYFEERTDGDVEYDHNRQIANLTLVSPVTQRKLDAAVTSLAASGSFKISGSAGDACAGGSGNLYANSYNSSGTSDDYCAQDSGGATGANGNITYGESIDISSGSGSSDIKGSLRSGGNVTVGPGGGQPFVDGNIFYTDSCNPSDSDCNSKSSGNVEQISGGLTAARPLTYQINSTADRIRSSNDNGPADISSDRLDFGASGSVTLSSGEYYLERIDFTGGNTLNIDTSGGDVTIVVRDYIAVGANQISVSGDNATKIYVRGEASTGGDMLSIPDGEISVANDDSPELRVYGPPDFNVTLGDPGGGSEAYFTGVIYAPPGPSGTGELVINKGHLIGGAVIGDTEIATQGTIHYDEALANTPVVDKNAKVVKITYLHVSVSRVRVS